MLEKKINFATHTHTHTHKHDFYSTTFGVVLHSIFSKIKKRFGLWKEMFERKTLILFWVIVLNKRKFISKMDCKQIWEKSFSIVCLYEWLSYHRCLWSRLEAKVKANENLRFYVYLHIHACHVYFQIIVFFFFYVLITSTMIKVFL